MSSRRGKPAEVSQLASTRAKEKKRLTGSVYLSTSSAAAGSTILLDWSPLRETCRGQLASTPQKREKLTGSIRVFAGFGFAVGSTVGPAPMDLAIPEAIFDTLFCYVSPDFGRGGKQRQIFVGDISISVNGRPKRCPCTDISPIFNRHVPSCAFMCPFTCALGSVLNRLIHQGLIQRPTAPIPRPLSKVLSISLVSVPARPHPQPTVPEPRAWRWARMDKAKD